MIEKDMSLEEMDKFLTDKSKSAKSKEAKSVKPKKSKKKNGIIVSIVAIATALLVVLGLNLNSKKKHKNSNQDTNGNHIVGVSIDDLGRQQDSEKQSTNFIGKTTGNVNKEDIHVDENGTVWGDKEAAENSSNVGHENIDTNNGEYTVDSDGSVHATDGYEVVDESGNTIDSGDGDIPEGYVYDSNLGAYVKAEDVGKYKYDEDGNLVLIDTVIPTETEVPTETEEPIETEAPTEASTNNSNGTYTDSFGNVWASKTDYDNGISNPDGIYIVDGLLYCDSPEVTKGLSNIIINSKVKTL